MSGTTSTTEEPLIGPYKNRQAGVASITAIVCGCALIVNIIVAVLTSKHLIWKQLRGIGGQMARAIQITGIGAAYGYVVCTALMFPAIILYMTGNAVLAWAAMGDTYQWWVPKSLGNYLFMFRLYYSFRGSKQMRVYCIGKEYGILFSILIIQLTVSILWNVFWAWGWKTAVFVDTILIYLTDPAFNSYLCYIFVERLGRLLVNLNEEYIEVSYKNKGTETSQQSTESRKIGFKATIVSKAGVSEKPVTIEHRGTNDVESVSRVHFGRKQMRLIDTMTKYSLLQGITTLATFLASATCCARWMYRTTTWLWISTLFVALDCLLSSVCAYLTFSFATEYYDLLLKHVHEQLQYIFVFHYAKKVDDKELVRQVVKEIEMASKQKPSQLTDIEAQGNITADEDSHSGKVLSAADSEPTQPHDSTQGTADTQ